MFWKFPSQLASRFIDWGLLLACTKTEVAEPRSQDSRVLRVQYLRRYDGKSPSLHLAWLTMAAHAEATRYPNGIMNFVICTPKL
jgi:hypothetical protein